MNLLLLLMPFISAVLGWFITWLTIKLFFQPRRIVRKLIKPLSTELFSSAELEAKLSSTESIGKLMPEVEVHIDKFLREKLTTAIPMLGMVIGDKTIGMVKAVFMQELRELFPILMKQYMSKLELDEIVASKGSHLSSGEFDYKLRALFKNELRKLQLVGAVLGFIIGLLQVAVTLLAP